MSRWSTLAERLARRNIGGAANQAGREEVMAAWADRGRIRADRGNPPRDPVPAVVVDGTGRGSGNPQAFSQRLLRPTRDSHPLPARDAARSVLATAATVLDRRLREISNDALHPLDRQLVAAAWVAGAEAVRSWAAGSPENTWVVQ